MTPAKTAVALVTLLSAFVIILSLAVAPKVCADHGGATFEHECVNGRQGNPDGTWCLWTNPDNGLRYLHTSEYEYRNGLPYYRP